MDEKRPNPEMEREFMPFSFIHNPSFLYLMDSVNSPGSYSEGLHGEKLVIFLFLMASL